MSRFEKAKERLRSRPKDYTYSDAKDLLFQLGFNEFNKGKTSGSRVKFYRVSDDEMSVGAIRDLAKRLEEIGEL